MGFAHKYWGYKLRVLLAAISLIFILYSTLNYPIQPIFNAITLFVLCFLLYRNSRYWLVFTPSFILAYDLVVFSGRPIFNELDFWVIASLAIIYSKPLNNHQISAKQLIPLLFIFIAFMNIDGSVLKYLNESIESRVYYSDLYPFKIAKGFLYGMLFGLILYIQYKEDQSSTIKMLIYGVWLATVTLIFIVLWERGTLAALVDFTSWWQIANTLLDFSSSYRITGIISDMHTGGESFDGVLIYIYAINLLSIMWFDDGRRKYIGFAFLVITLYCIFVGYTRATYFASATITFFSIILCYKHAAPNFQLNRTEIVTFSGILLLTVIAFKFGGYSALMSISILVSITLFLNCSKFMAGVSLLGKAILLAIAVVASILFAIHHINESKWVINTTLSCVIVAIILVTFCVGITSQSIGSNSSTEYSNFTIKYLVVTVISIAIAIPLGSYQSSSRFDNLAHDLLGRIKHWSEVVESANSSTLSKVIGNGSGQFPKNYAINLPQKVTRTGNFRVINNRLHLANGSDLSIGQRVTLKPDTNYEISMQLDGELPIIIEVSLCERNLIYSTNFSKNCSVEDIVVNEGNLENSYKIVLNSNNLDSNLFKLRWPTGLFLKNKGNNGVVAIDGISIRAINSETNLIRNGGFDSGLDHWYSYNDYEHLAWHIKNLFVALYYQYGYLGLVLFLWVVYTTTRSFSGTRKHLLIRSSMLAFTFGVICLGLFSDPLDSPKAALLFFTALYFNFLLSCEKDSPNSAFGLSLLTKATIFIFGILMLLGVIFTLRYITQLSFFELIKNEPNQFSIMESKYDDASGSSYPSYEYWLDEVVGPSNEDIFNNNDVVFRIVKVENEHDFIRAVQSAQEGDEIVLEPGKYYFSGHSIELNRKGALNLPIKIKAREKGTVRVFLDLVEGFHISSPYWSISGLIIEGNCTNQSKCEHAVHVVGNGKGFRLENNIIKNFNSPIKVNQKHGLYPDDGIIRANSFYNETPRKTNSSVTFLDIVSANNWFVANNFIADFAKNGSDNTSYGVFFKGGGESNTFENNVVLCEWKHFGGIRIGASAGGGGTAEQYCRNKECIYEQSNSVIRSNLIMHCPMDVGVYINKGRDIKLTGNILYNTRGVDVRFKESNAYIFNNIIDGRIWARDGASVVKGKSETSIVGALKLSSYVEDIFVSPYRGNFELKESNSELVREGINNGEFLMCFTSSRMSFPILCQNQLKVIEEY